MRHAGTAKSRPGRALQKESHLSDAAVYPATITYPNQKYRVVFTRVGGRLDYDSGWDTDNAAHFFQRSRLASIQVQKSVGGGSWLTIREYKFTYNTEDIYPGLVWQAGGKTLTLTGVQEFGISDGSQPFLPPTTFSYDGAHLETAINGYGGQVDFVYDEWHETYGPFLTNPFALESRKIVQNFSSQNLCNRESGTPPVPDPSTGGWEAIPGVPQNKVACSGNNLLIQGVQAENELSDSLIQPGATYVLRVNVEDVASGETIQLGLRDNGYGGGTNYYAPAQAITSSGWYTFTVTLPNYATRDVDLRINCIGGDCELEDYVMILAPTRYRVMSRTATATQGGSPITTAYCYTADWADTTAANCQNGAEQARTSWPSLRVNAGSNPFNVDYSEFRGHGIVTEYAPTGVKTVTTFCQTDDCKGMPVKVEVFAASTGTLYQRVETTYVTERLSTDPAFDDSYVPYTPVLLDDIDGNPSSTYTGLDIVWTRVLTEVVSICNGASSCQKRQTTYGYNIAYSGWSQFGNLTDVVESSWNGSAWVDYRASRTWYLPMANIKYLVGLPIGSVQYACPSSPCTFTTAVSSANFIYDTNTSYDQQPTTGILKKTLAWVDTLGGSPNPDRFSRTDYGYDAWGNLTTTTRYGGYQVGSSTAGSPPSGARTTTTTYDGTYHTYVLSIQNALSQPPIVFVYDYNLAAPTSITDPNGNTTTATYDDFARLLTVRQPGDESGIATITLTYNDLNQTSVSMFTTTATQKMDASSTTTVRKFYDGLGRLLQSQLAGALLADDSCSDPHDADLLEETCDVLVDVLYDAAGRAWKQSVPHAVLPGSGSYIAPNWLMLDDTYTTFDTVGRPFQQFDTANVPQSTYSYGLLQTTVTDAGGNVTTIHNDIWGRTVEVHPPADPWTRYTYDTANRLTVVEQMEDTNTVLAGFQTYLYYNQAGLKISMDDPDMGIWTYTYDALGSLDIQTDARTCTIDFNYDLLNRLTGKTYGGPGACNDTPDVTYTYDSVAGGNEGIGRRTSMTDGSGNTAWKYDIRGRLIRATNTVNSPTGGTFTTQSTYNSANQPVTMTYPGNSTGGSGEIVRYGYHPQGSLDSLCTWNGSACTSSYLTNSAYDEAGRMTHQAFALGSNSLTRDYTYAPWDTSPGAGRLTHLLGQKVIGGTPTTLQDLYYTYTNTGNVDTLRDVQNGDQQQCFTYDSLSRLTAAWTGGSNPGCTDTAGNGMYSETYTYDPANGNLASKTGQNGYIYGDPAHPHAVTATNSSVNGYAYDANGNMIHRSIAGDGIYALTYDAENRLISVTKTGFSASFVYDGDGNRVKSTLNGVTTTFIGGHLEWKGTVESMVKYYNAGGSMAMRTGNTSGVTNLTYLLGDHLNSTSLSYRADTGATVTQLYKPWGEVRYSSGSLPTKYTYTGQYSYAGSGEFGLMFYNARWYDGALGRFVQADSIVPGAFTPMAYDRYAYVLNSPLNYTDPSGHGACDGKYKVPECDDIADKGRVVTPGVRGRELEEWEILLLTIAVMAETMTGEIPDDAIAAIAWSFLNRLAYGSHATIYDAIKGLQSAFDAYAGANGLFPMQEDETAEEYATRFFSEYADITSGAWAKVYAIVQNAYQDWAAYGADSSVDPTNGATDFRAKRLLADIPRQEGIDWCSQDKTCNGLSQLEQNIEIDKHILSLSYESAMDFHAYQLKNVPGWRVTKLGPMTAKGVTFWLFFDNRSTIPK